MYSFPCLLTVRTLNLIKSDWGKYSRFVFVKKNWLNVSSLQQRSLDFDPTFKIERGEETLHNYAFIGQIYHILIQTSNLLTAINNAFLLACEQISLTLPPRSQWHFVSSTLIIICFLVFTVGEEIYPVC